LTSSRALAVHHGGRLVSFDRRLSCEAVVGGREALWLIKSVSQADDGAINSRPGKACR
jgi:hypothetical protein